MVGVSLRLVWTAGEYSTPDEALFLRKWSFKPLMERSSWLERIWKYTFMKSTEREGDGEG